MRRIRCLSPALPPNVPPRRCFSALSLSSNPALLAHLAALEARRASVAASLSSSAELQRDARARLSRELNRLEQMEPSIAAFRSAHAEVRDLEAVAAAGGGGGGASADADAAELAAMARAELAEAARPALAAAEADLLQQLLPRDEADDRNVILEVRAGVGGDEAGLFAGEVLRMYQGYAAARGWRWEAALLQEEKCVNTHQLGLREGVVEVSGEGAYRRLKFESGVHRVQRVPATESTTKLQTSTCSVTVLPAASEVDVEIRPADLRIDTYRSGGAGGQSVNTTDSAVRITHLPTGTVVSIQDERSQLQNKLKAMAVLRSRIFDAERTRLEESRSRARKSQIGKSGRGERVRTYNFPQSRVTDHRVGVTVHDAEAMMRGEELDAIVDALLEAEQGELLERLVEEALAAAAKAGKAA
jgi:peptide chain release factor 1